MRTRYNLNMRNLTLYNNALAVVMNTRTMLCVNNIVRYFSSSSSFNCHCRL